MRPTSNRARHGFSLVEIMVVIVILGLMSGIALVSWEALFPNQEFHTAVRKLSDVLHSTRSEAIARSREFRIYYDLENDVYGVRTPFLTGGGIALSDEDEDLRTDPTDRVRLWVDENDLGRIGIDILSVTIDDTVYRDGVVYVRFDALGSSSYHTIVLHQQIFDRSFTVEALPLTGDIRFHEGVFEREIADEGDFD